MTMQDYRVPAMAQPTLKFSLVVPTYNESANIIELLTRIIMVLDRCIFGAYEIIVVDDNSPDKTWQLCTDYAKAKPQVKVINRQGERGLSSAVIRGWQQARGAILGVIDGDAQHPPETLQSLLHAIKQHDIAIASRHVKQGGVDEWSIWRRLTSRVAQGLAMLIVPKVGCRVRDPMSGYFVLKRQAIADISLRPLGYKILLECLGRGRIDTIAEIAYIFNERTHGASKVSYNVYVDYLKQLLLLRFT